MENCEVWTVPAERIWSLHVEGLSKDLSFYQYDKTIHEYLECKSFWFSIEVDALETIAVPEGWWTNRPMTFQKRLDDIRDLTHIDLMYEDGTNLYIGVPYHVESDGPFLAPNVWQKPGKIKHYRNGTTSTYALHIRDPSTDYEMKPKRDPFKKYRRKHR